MHFPEQTFLTLTTFLKAPITPLKCVSRAPRAIMIAINELNSLNSTRTPPGQIPDV